MGVDGGIQVTGSHNPADYNGFKMLLNGRSVFGEEIKALGRRAEVADWVEGLGEVTEADVIPAYLDALLKDFDGQPFRIGWDNGNGAGGEILERLLERLPGEHHPLYTEVDGTFPNHHPDPTVEANLADLKVLVAEQKLDFGIAFDGDADRIGAVDGKGRVIWGDQLLMVLAGPVLKDLPGATIIADVKASQTLFDRIAEMGGTPLMWKTGHSLIKSKMKETGSPLAGEMSGHIFFKHQWYGFDDALYAAIRLIRAVSESGKTDDPIAERNAGLRRHAGAALPDRRYPQVRRRRRSRRPPRRRRRERRHHRWRPGEDRRRLVAPPRVQHPGRPRRPRRGEGPGRARPADGDARRPTRPVRHHARRRGSLDRRLPVIIPTHRRAIPQS